MDNFLPIIRLLRFSIHARSCAGSCRTEWPGQSVLSTSLPSLERSEPFWSQASCPCQHSRAVEFVAPPELTSQALRACILGCVCVWVLRETRGRPAPCTWLLCVFRGSRGESCRTTSSARGTRSSIPSTSSSASSTSSTCCRVCSINESYAFLSCPCGLSSTAGQKASSSSVSLGSFQAQGVPTCLVTRPGVLSSCPAKSVSQHTCNWSTNAHTPLCRKAFASE